MNLRLLTTSAFPIVLFTLIAAHTTRDKYKENFRNHIRDFGSAPRVIK